MNIKNRIGKIEEKLNINSAFCSCVRDVLFKVLPYEDREKEIEPAICESCRKPVEQNRFTFKFNSNAEYIVLEPKANFTREEFEVWQREHVIGNHISYEEFLKEQEGV